MRLNGPLCVCMLVGAVFECEWECVTVRWWFAVCYLHMSPVCPAKFCWHVQNTGHTYVSGCMHVNDVLEDVHMHIKCVCLLFVYVFGVCFYLSCCTSFGHVCACMCISVCSVCACAFAILQYQYQTWEGSRCISLQKLSAKISTCPWSWIQNQLKL